MDIVAIKKKLEPKLIRIRGVVGVGADIHNDRLVVYVESEDVIPRVKPYLRGVPAKFEVVGRVRV